MLTYAVRDNCKLGDSNFENKSQISHDSLLFTVFPSIFSLCAHAHLKNTMKSHILLACEQTMLNFVGHTGNRIVMRSIY